MEGKRADNLLEYIVFVRFELYSISVNRCKRLVIKYPVAKLCQCSDGIVFHCCEFHVIIGERITF